MKQKTTTGVASQAGHWYRQDGTPCYQIEMKTKPGEMRNVNLGDARKLGLVPSVTTIMRVLSAPGLERWKQNNILLSALTLPHIDGESLDEFSRRVMEDAAEQGRAAAQRGTDIHEAIEKSFSGEFDPQYGQHVTAAIKEINKLFDGEWNPEKSFSSELGYGGKVDLFSGAGFVVDFKTKEFTSEDLQGKKKLHFDEMAYQLAAYRYGLGLPEATCANVFVSVSEPGLAYTHIWKEDDLKSGFVIFTRALEIWQSKSKYHPLQQTRSS